MFIRRYYYDNTSGETVLSYWMEGSIFLPTIESDYENHEELSNRSTDNTGLFEWTEKDEEIEQNFVDSYDRVSVDVTKDPHELVFDFSPLPEPPIEEDELEIAKQALTELGVDVNA